MERFLLLPLVLSCAAVFTLSGCGGGGSMDDGQTPLSVSPETVTLTSSTDVCLPAAGPTVFALGGTAPYSLRNPLPDAIGLSSDTIARSGEGVTITFKGGCMQAIPIVIIDSIGNTAIFRVNYVAGR
ncbi:MAG: hypothetical protein KUL84_09940 [Diaphorobacter sp.]|nr:hypothetical protein [Diaphorobacter sp.]